MIKISKRIHLYLQEILKGQSQIAKKEKSEFFFAPSNIALAKYWGKRDEELFLPENSSLSLSLGSLGAKTRISYFDGSLSKIILNGNTLDIDSSFAKPMLRFLSLFEDFFQKNPKRKNSFLIETYLNIPHSSGLASSACGFAALSFAFSDLMGWNLSLSQISQIARLGSGSASRSVYRGFVTWHKGECPFGYDSLAQPLDIYWPQLRWGIIRCDKGIKEFSSRQAMRLSKFSSPLYSSWVTIAQELYKKIVQSVLSKNFTQLGETMEQSCEMMHCVIQTSTPKIFYRTSQTLSVIETVFLLRRQGVEVYYTQDAGSHLKILFEKKNTDKVISLLEDKVQIINPFEQF
jgi:diphosphomevalonate decarboxylase